MNEDLEQQMRALKQKLERRERASKAAKKAAHTKILHQTNYVYKWYPRPLPKWITTKEDLYGPRVCTRDGIVLDARKVPIILVNRNSFADVLGWVTWEMFQDLAWKMFGKDTKQIPLGFSDYVMAPEDCRETGELPP